MEAPVAVVAEEQLVVVLRGPAQRASLAFYTEQHTNGVFFVFKSV